MTPIEDWLERSDPVGPRPGLANTREMTMKQYDLINPSDPITVESECPTVAAVAALILSDGGYGLRDELGQSVLPVFVGGSQRACEDWLESEGIESLTDYVVRNAERIADVLDSSMVGTASDRAAYREGLEKCDGCPNRIRDWRTNWDDRHRTSITRVCQDAWSLASTLRSRCSESRAGPEPVEAPKPATVYAALVHRCRLTDEVTVLECGGCPEAEMLCWGPLPLGLSVVNVVVRGSVSRVLKPRPPTDGELKIFAIGAPWPGPQQATRVPGKQLDEQCGSIRPEDGR